MLYNRSFNFQLFTKWQSFLSKPPATNKAKVMTVMGMQMVGILRLPLLSVAELLMSPVMKEDSCFLTVSFHIRRIRLCEQDRRHNGEKEFKVVENW